MQGSFALTKYQIKQFEKDRDNIDLKMVRRRCKDLDKILHKCRFSQLFQMPDESIKVWHNLDFAGPTFLVRTTKNKILLILVNQKNLNDYIADVSTWIQYEINDEFLYYRNKDGLFGFWIKEQASLNFIDKQIAPIIKNKDDSNKQDQDKNQDN